MLSNNKFVLYLLFISWSLLLGFFYLISSLFLLFISKLWLEKSYDSNKNLTSLNVFEFLFIVSKLIFFLLFVIATYIFKFIIN